MIGHIRGKLLQKQPPFLLVDVNGIGYELEAPMSTFYELPPEQSEVSLYAHLVVREDAQLLYGFSDQSQREMFRSLLKVSGIGPRVALAILSTFNTREFVKCIQYEDTGALTRVPGIGKKTAERMIIDLRDRISLTDSEMTQSIDPSREIPDNPVEDAVGALVALGYKPVDASRAVNAVKSQSEQRDDLIRNALQFLTSR